MATSLGLYGHLFLSLDGQIADGMDATRSRVLAERGHRPEVVGMAAVRLA